MDIHAAYRHCRSVIRTHSTSFYLAFRSLPKEKRNAVYAVYAFCRLTDDAVDEREDPAELDRIQDRVEQIDTASFEDPVWMALQHTHRTFGLDKEPYRHLIRGQRFDLAFPGVPDEDVLLRYCFQVASSVGLMLLPILATQHAEALKPAACRIGTAMQLTNILRDIGEDLDRGRVYLPESARTPAFDRALSSRTPNEGFIEVWERFARRAEQDYAAGLRDLRRFDPDSRRPLLTSLVYYRGILDAVRAQGYDCLTQRCRVRNRARLNTEIRRIAADWEEETG